MKNRFEFLPGAAAGEDDASHFMPAQRAIGSDEVRPELMPDFRKRRLAGLDELAGQFIGINNPGTVL